MTQVTPRHTRQSKFEKDALIESCFRLAGKHRGEAVPNVRDRKIDRPEPDRGEQNYRRGDGEPDERGHFRRAFCRHFW